MAGPFERFLNPWDSMRQSSNIDDRTEDPWPWLPLDYDKHKPYGTPSLKTTAEFAVDRLIPPQIPAVTALSRDAGARDIGPIPPEELIKFLMSIDALNAENK